MPFFVLTSVFVVLASVLTVLASGLAVLARRDLTLPYLSSYKFEFSANF